MEITGEAQFGSAPRGNHRRHQCICQVKHAWECTEGDQLSCEGDRHYPSLMSERDKDAIEIFEANFHLADM